GKIGTARSRGVRSARLEAIVTNQGLLGVVKQTGTTVNTKLRLAWARLYIARGIGQLAGTTELALDQSRSLGRPRERCGLAFLALGLRCIGPPLALGHECWAAPFVVTIAAWAMLWASTTIASWACWI
ncbi:hypothetical protein DVH24_023319, partial [Malus domestica]